MSLVGRLFSGMQGLVGALARPPPAAPASRTVAAPARHAATLDLGRDCFEPARRVPVDLTGRGVEVPVVELAPGPAPTIAAGNGFLADLDDVGPALAPAGTE